jgi:acyl-CoA reductase-like NAD-dependent aldehyde dehydrogenase
MQTFETTDPATGEVLAEVPISDAESIRQAVERARAAGERWAAVPYEARGAALLAAAERLAEREQELADLVTREMGKPRAEALGEIRGRARGMERLVDEVGRAIAPERVEGQNVQSVILREPLGVVAAITPWNFPVGMPCSILLPALLTGNAVVFKPSEHVPLVGAALAEILSTFLPDGVLELVQGPGEVGAQLVDSDVQMIGFVGSRDTGVRIMRAAAECAVRHSLRNAGQVCCSIERVYVAEEVADAFEAKVLELARGWRPGNGFDPETRLGPMVSGAQRDKVAAQVGDAVARGGRLLH